MGRGGAHSQASAGSLLFGTRTRGTGPLNPSQLASARRALSKNVVPADILSLSGVLAPGSLDSTCIGVVDRHGNGLDWLDVYATSQIWVNSKTGAQRIIKMGVAMTGEERRMFGAALIAVDERGQASCPVTFSGRSVTLIKTKMAAAVAAGPSGRRPSKFWQPLATAAASQAHRKAVPDGQDMLNELRRRWDDPSWPTRASDFK